MLHTLCVLHTRCASCAGDGHVLAVAGGRVWGWGSNQVGQLGLGSCTPWQAVPADITAALDGAWKVRRASHLAASQQSSACPFTLNRHHPAVPAVGSFYQCQVLVKRPYYQQESVMARPQLTPLHAVAAHAAPGGGMCAGSSLWVKPQCAADGQRGGVHGRLQQQRAVWTGQGAAGGE